MKDVVNSGVLTGCLSVQWGKGIRSSSGSRVRTEERQKGKCAIVRPMGVKRAMREPEITDQKSLLIREEMHHLLPMSFHPWNLPWEETQKEKPFHLCIVGCQQVAAAPCLTKRLSTSHIICLLPCLSENKAEKKKKSPHQKLFWHCWSSLAQVLRGCRRWAESWGSPALCGELQGDQAVWRKGGMWGLGNAEFLFCRRSSCCYSGFCVFNHQMQLLSFDRIRRKAVYNGALTAWHTPNLWFKAFFVLNLFL